VQLDLSDDTLCFKALSEVGTATEPSASADLSSTGESIMADPSKIFRALASFIVDKVGFRIAGVTVGLVPDDVLFATNVSDFFILAAL
jgi:hypothetical protein